ncbi:MAG: signal peptidase II [Clostridia bacterium]|nr:signal peptidase II [Clostridia bacterium]
MKKIVIALGLIILDQLTKALVRMDGFKGNWLFTHVENEGAAFNSFSGETFILIVLPLVVIGIGIFYLVKHKDSKYSLPLILMISGGLGNQIDRIFRGSVTDMINLHVWPVFNLADAFVVVGAVILAVTLIFFDGEKKK